VVLENLTTNLEYEGVEIEDSSMPKEVFIEILDDKSMFVFISKHSISVIALETEISGALLEVNDTLGHRQGDQILKELGTLLDSAVRDSDFVCRYGGDEFVIIFPETDLESARAKAEDLRDRVAAHDFLEQSLEAELPLTLSAGVASTRDSIDARGLLNQADRALYEAKRSGKNLVVTID
ncbi:MAG: GGDEF domain-containing protein, partial [Planctomycetota bacterium]